MTIYHCIYCSKEIEVAQHRINNSPDGRFFCNQACLIADRRKHKKLHSCEKCGKEFYGRAGRKLRFCSKECCNISFHENADQFKLIEHKRFGKEIGCITCGKSFYVPPSGIHRKYCSIKCKRAPNPNFIGKVTKTGDYLHIYLPTHPFSSPMGHYPEHRHIAEKVLGRYLHPVEVIHHINEIQTDNRPENLYLFPNNSEHISYHNNVRYRNCTAITESNLESLRIKE